MTLAKVPHGVFIAMTSRITLFAGVRMAYVSSGSIYLLKRRMYRLFLLYFPILW